MLLSSHNEKLKFEVALDGIKRSDCPTSVRYLVVNRLGVVVVVGVCAKKDVVGDKVVLEADDDVDERILLFRSGE